VQQLLQIENVPIKLEVKSTRAKFEKPEIPAADLNSLIKSINMQNTGKTSGISSVISDNNSYPAKDVYVSDSGWDSSSGSLAGYQSFVDDSLSTGLFQSSVSSDFIKAAVQNSMISSGTFGQTSHSEFIENQMSLYANDRSNFDISVDLGLTEMEFVPGSVEFTVVQKPAVNISYIGSPIYVPKSADPNYVDVYA
jgi:hypothetical protein